MIKVLTWALAACALLVQEGDMVADLEKRVSQMSSRDLHDAALKALKQFTADHPTLAEEGRVERLRDRIAGLAREADGIFRSRLAEAQNQLEKGLYARAMETASSALQYYPERRPQISAFLDRARVLLPEQGMVKVPRVACWIGSDLRPEERPLRQVTLPSFLIDKYPVTNEEYAAYVALTGATPPSDWSEGRPPKGSGRRPVVLVAWPEAAAYATWAGKRLPTSEEWEVAARGTDRRKFPWGNTFIPNEADSACNSIEYWQIQADLPPGTTPVDQFAIQLRDSAFGACMGGNVWEWTSTGIPGQIRGQAAELLILKGGSFLMSERAVRCAAVLPENPRLQFHDVGFRCAKDAP
jgi:formylglycine-generating enzyme required for sulfatase activity